MLFTKKTRNNHLIGDIQYIIPDLIKVYGIKGYRTDSGASKGMGWFTSLIVAESDRIYLMDQNLHPDLHVDRMLQVAYNHHNGMTYLFSGEDLRMTLINRGEIETEFYSSSSLIKMKNFINFVKKHDR